VTQPPRRKSIRAVVSLGAFIAAALVPTCLRVAGFRAILSIGGLLLTLSIGIAAIGLAAGVSALTYASENRLAAWAGTALNALFLVVMAILAFT
jgi:hypothetical protein